MSKSKKTLVLGASTNPERYSFKAINKLIDYGNDVVAVGLKKGNVRGVEIEPAEMIHHDIDTLTLYVGPKNQKVYFDYILNTHPQRVIFNPGTENPELQEMLEKNNIEPVEACTLVLLSTGQY